MSIAIDTSFVPADLDATDFANVEPYVRKLLSREPQSGAELERWLIDRGALEASCSEAKANLYIAMTCDTEDAQAQAAYAKYVGEVQPKLTPAFFELDRRYVELSTRINDLPARYAVADRTIRTDVELYREENVALETELARLS